MNPPLPAWKNRRWAREMQAKRHGDELECRFMLSGVSPSDAGCYHVEECRLPCPSAVMAVSVVVVIEPLLLERNI